MDPHEYDKLAELDRDHWWYRALQDLVFRLARPAIEGADHPRILDAGCGAGGALGRFQGHGGCVGMDASLLALRYCVERAVCVPCQGSVAAIPFAPATFDLVLCLDVLYHAGVEDDVQALREIHRVLKPGGRTVVNVPAYECLRSTHDVAIHTRHRYTRQELVAKLADAGLRVCRATYWNTLLFPAAALVRLVKRGGTEDHESDLKPTHPWVNRILYALAQCEGAALRCLDMPLGLSVLCSAAKP